MRSWCLAKHGTTEDQPFGPDVLVFRIETKIYALTNLESIPAAVHLKCDPAPAENLRERYTGIMPGYHMNKKHWNTVALASDVPETLVRRLIDHSYALVAESLGKDARKRFGIQISDSFDISSLLE